MSTHLCACTTSRCRSSRAAATPAQPFGCNTVALSPPNRSRRQCCCCSCWSSVASLWTAQVPQGSVAAHLLAAAASCETVLDPLRLITAATAGPLLWHHRGQCPPVRLCVCVCASVRASYATTGGCARLRVCARCCCNTHTRGVVVQTVVVRCGVVSTDLVLNRRIYCAWHVHRHLVSNGVITHKVYTHCSRAASTAPMHLCMQAFVCNVCVRTFESHARLVRAAFWLECELARVRRRRAR